MLSSVLLAVALSVSAVSAAPALSVSLSGAQNFVGVSSAVVSATVKNTGDETVRVLNHPSTVLSKGATDAFTISSSNGKSPRFQGLFAKYVPGPKKSFTTLEPGQSVTVKHSLGDAYDFTKSGRGTYSIKPSPAFYIVTDDGVKTLTADVTPHTASLSGSLVKPGSVFVESDGCSDSVQQAIGTAAQHADTLVHQAVRAILGPHGTPHYTTWFGAYSASRYSRVSETYANVIKSSFASNVTYECIAAERCAGMVDSDAFTMADAKNHIWICPAFLDLELDGTESQAGVLVHLATHWTDNGRTGHWAFGQENCELLAENFPDLSVDNADSYEYYTENSPPLE